MDRNIFYDTLSILSINERIEFLLTADYDFSMEEQPDAVLSHFDDINTAEEAMSVAKTFKERFGNIILCREASSCWWELTTIMDCIHDLFDHPDQEPSSHNLLKDAFKALGFKSAIDYDTRELIHLYCLDPIYGELFDRFNVHYNYDLLKKANENIDQELQEYFFHPPLIEKWINDGNELEDYLN